MTKMELKSCKKGYTYDQDKAILPEDTVRHALARLEAFGQPLIGSFHKINHLFDMSMYRIDSSDYVLSMFPILKGANGKGAADAQARASCVMEFIERLSINLYGGWKRTRYADFKEGEALPLASIGKTLNYVSPGAGGGLLDKLGSIPLDWAEAYDFSTGKNIFIPKFFINDCTTGLSAGNTLEEALLQAICECVERHIGAYVQWNKGEYPTVEKSSIDSPVASDLIKKLERRGMDVVIKDFSGVLDIPALGVILLDREYRDDIGQALGVCCSKEKALIRALTESVQGIENRTSDMLKSRSVSFYCDSYGEAEYLLSGSVIGFEEVIDISAGDIKTEIEKCIEILSRRGMEVMAVDIEHEKIKIPAVWVYLKNAFLFYLTNPLPFYVGTLLLENGRWDDAVSCLEKLKGSAVSNSEMYMYGMGVCYQNMRKSAEALEFFKKALESNSEVKKKMERGIIHYHIGLCHLDMGKFDSARASFEKSSEQGFDKAAAGFHIGVCYFQKSDYLSALKYLEPAVSGGISGKIEKKIAYPLLGECCNMLGRYEKAVGLLEDAARAGVTGWQINYQLGMAYQGMGRHREAIENFDAAYGESSGDTDRAEIKYQAGYSEIELGERSRAKETLRAAVSYKPPRGDIYNLLGKIYMDEGDAGNAERVLKEGIANAPGDWANYNLLGVVYREQGMLEESERVLKKAIEISPGEWRNYNVLGNVYLRRGDTAGAEKMFEQALRLCDDNSYKKKIKDSLDEVKKAGG